MYKQFLKRSFMARYRVRQTGKNRDGDITHLCHIGQSWSPRSVAGAIRDIKTVKHSYFVNEAGYEAQVRVLNRGGREFLATDADATSKNNLDNLPNC